MKPISLVQLTTCIFLAAGAAYAKPNAIIEKMRDCLAIDDVTKERLDCYDLVVRPEPRTPAPKAKNISDCRFLKEEDERLMCFNKYVAAKPTPSKKKKKSTEQSLASPAK